MSQSIFTGPDQRVEAVFDAATAKSPLSGFARVFAQAPVAFDVHLTEGAVQHFGQGSPEFHIRLNNRRGTRALASLDEGRIADAYLLGDIDFEGNPMSPFKLRAEMSYWHLLTAAWRFIEPLLFGQVHTNKSAIGLHYEIDADFFLSFLDPKTPCYTQGVFESAEESLDAATLRKFDYCYRQLGLKPGDHILEIGPGWGAWFEYASDRGIKCTGISISQASLDFLERRAKMAGHEWTLIHGDLLSYQSKQRYDAIVMMGVIEHLRNTTACSRSS